MWMGLALLIESRLWIADVVHHSRDRSLADRLLRQVRTCAHSVSQVLVCVDGWGAYPKAIVRAFRERVKTTAGIGCTYNLCWVHQQLGRTPAMAAELTDHVLSVKEVLCYKVASAPFAPPKRPRGRPRTRPHVDGSAVKAQRGRPSKYLSILRRLQEEKRAALLQGACSTTG